MRQRIAVLGLGRSGYQVAISALRRGNIPVVLDESPAEAIQKRELIDGLVKVGVEVRTGQRFSENPELFPVEAFDLLVPNPAVDHRHPLLQFLSAQGFPIWSEIEYAYRISEAPIIAITGTNGKSTTTVMTWLGLQALGFDAKLCGNVYGTGYPEQTLTEAADSATPQSILVAEVSSFQLEWVDKFQPISAGITNIWPDHLERYDSFEDYAATKMRIYAAQTGDDCAVVKGMDPVVRLPWGQPNGNYVSRAERLQTSSSGNKPPQAVPCTLTFGASGEAVELNDAGVRIFGKQYPTRSLPYRDGLTMLNGSMAICLAMGALRGLARGSLNPKAAEILIEAGSTPPFADLSSLRCPPKLVEAIFEFQGIRNRMEYLGEQNGVTFINNSMCTNVDAVLKSLQALKDPTHVLIGGVNKGLDFRPLGNYLANRRHTAYLYGRDRREINEMLSGLWQEFETMPEAFRAAVSSATAGTVVMLAPGCASFDQFRDFQHRGDVFREVVTRFMSGGEQG